METPSFAKQFRRAVGASGPLLLVRSSEPEEVLRQVRATCDEYKWPLWNWDARNGLEYPGKSADEAAALQQAAEAAKAQGLPKPASLQPKPLGVVEGATGAVEGLIRVNNMEGDGEERTSIVLTMQNAHRLFDGGGPQVMRLIQTFQDFAPIGKDHNKSVVFVCPRDARLPSELEHLFLEVHLPLPSVGDYEAILRSNILFPDGTRPNKQLSRAAAEAAKGLTRFQFEQHASEQVVASGEIDPRAVWEHKVALFNQEGFLEVYEPEVGLDGMSGMGFFKDVLVKLIKKGRAPKVLNSGPPGTGKTAGAMALGYDVGLNVVLVQLDKAYHMWVGSSEERTRQIQQLLQQFAPCVAVFNELPRFISTNTGGRDQGSSVDAKIGGQWLLWFESPKARDVVVMATANESAGVQTLARAERFDFNIYTSIRSPKAKKRQIWEIYRKLYKIDDTQLPDDAMMTGGEQKAVCRLASAEWLGEPLAAANDRVTRVWNTMRAEVEELEDWGRTNCVDVETGRRFAPLKADEIAAPGALAVGGGNARPVRKLKMEKPPPE